MQLQRDTTTGRIRGTTPVVEEAARSMRRSLTPAEAKLWQTLRGRKLRGLKFRCQHPVGPYVLDFYCPARKLVVELDGSAHDNQREHDQTRTERLAEHGYQVIRFRNEDVLHDLDAVVKRIEEAAFRDSER